MNDSRNDETIGGFKTVANHHAAEPVPRPAEPATIGGMPTREKWSISDDKRFHSHRWKPGEEILGRYVVEKELGQGGMGVVYGCFDKVGGVRVAVKALPPELSHNSVEMEEVRENFALVDELRHPNIAGVRTLEKDERGEYFLVMDIAEGESLRRWIRHKWKAGGVSFAEAIPILRQIAAALDYAHKMRVVHRDVKPGNVMIDNKGDVKVLDFGLAAQIRTSLSRASQAYRGTSGTGPYMAPEQWRGKPQDGRADQYALGVMAYEMLSGRLPFENSETSVLREAVLHDEVPTLLGLPKAAMAALRRAMAKKAEDRFASCGAFVSALAGRPGAPGRNGPAGRPRPAWGGWMALVLLLAIAGAGAWIAWRGWKQNQPFQESPGHVQELEANRAEAERLAEEVRKAEEERLAAEKASFQEARRLEKERVNAEREEKIRQENEELEETVYRLAPLAKTKVGNVEAMGYDRGQGFGAHLEEMSAKLGQGEAAMAARNFAKAKSYFESAMSAAAWCEENEPLRDAARKARDAAQAAKGKADAMDGAHLGLRAYRQAETKRDAASKAFEATQFRDAAAAWNEANASYVQAEKDALAAKIAQGLEAARGAKKRNAWEDCIKAAEGVLALAAGNAEAKQLKAEAQKQIDDARKAKEEEQRRKEQEEAARRREAERQAEEARKAAEAKKAMEAVAKTPANGRTKTITLPGGATMEMVWCPPGTFTMGSPSNEEGRDDVETQHQVTLTKGFWMAKTEVTQKQWKSVMGTTVRQQRDKANTSWSLRGEGDDYPMYYVNWNEAQEFCRRAGNGLQLPTEAQWEYACRAGSTGPYAGIGRLKDMGWYGGIAWFAKTHPVGTKRANAWGLHDMHGNVYEFCADWYGDYPNHAVTDPTGVVSGGRRVVRGGSWNVYEGYCRSAHRCSASPDLRTSILGFRPVSVQP